ncbi:MAG: DEAD/DEAH box helicase [Sphingopyxis sp.]|nr:DEAD/DEAH box helicase [Sphingopyxis sp.]
MAVDAGDLPDKRIGLEDSKVWDMLYRFQRDGVLGAVGKLAQWGGCIIADSVGLGKTFEALAVIKYYELRNERVLVLSPKRLRVNWTLWTHNDVRNPLATDRFAFDVLSCGNVRSIGRDFDNGLSLSRSGWCSWLVRKREFRDDFVEIRPRHLSHPLLDQFRTDRVARSAFGQLLLNICLFAPNSFGGISWGESHE